MRGLPPTPRNVVSCEIAKGAAFSRSSRREYVRSEIHKERRNVRIIPKCESNTLINFSVENDHHQNQVSLFSVSNVYERINMEQCTASHWFISCGHDTYKDIFMYVNCSSFDESVMCLTTQEVSPIGK